MVRESCSEEQGPEGSERGSVWIPGGRVSRAEGTASTKVLRWDRPEHVQMGNRPVRLESSEQVEE